MKPIFYLNLDDEGRIVETKTLHPTSPPINGGVWLTYAHANSNLASALSKVTELEAKTQQLTNRVYGLEVQRAMREQERSEGMQALEGGK